MTHAETEKNPAILTTIIKSWGTRPGDAAIATALTKHLNSKTYQNTLAAAAISAYRAQDEAIAVTAILAKLQNDPLEFRTWDYRNALDAIAFLARKQENRDAVRSFLVTHLSHPKEELRSGAAKALGTLRDPKAISVLQAMLPEAGPYADPVREAAAKSLQTLQAEQPGSAELKSLWDQVQQLQKKTEDLQNRLDEAKKKAEPAKK